MSLATFIFQVMFISMSGVMAPGAVTAVTISAGIKHRHAGLLLAVGHMIVEFPLICLIIAGGGTVLEISAVRIAIGLLGGIVLLWMGTAGLLSRKPLASNDSSAIYDKSKILWSGVIVSAANPYFLLWWATIGLALAGKAQKLGVTGFLIFALVHWLGDFIWLELLSYAAHKGSKITSPKVQKMILRICGLAMSCFGLWFIIDALMVCF